MIFTTQDDEVIFLKHVIMISELAQGRYDVELAAGIGVTVNDSFKSRTELISEVLAAQT